MLVIRTHITITPPNIAYTLYTSPAYIDAVANDLLRSLALETKNQAFDNAPFATGGLRDSIKVENEFAPGHVKWEVTATGDESRYSWSRPGRPYAAYVEFGGRPHWPPPQPIAAWIRVQMPEEAADPKKLRSLTFLVMRKIARRGTPEIPFMRDAVESALSTLRPRLAESARAVVRVFLR